MITNTIQIVDDGTLDTVVLHDGIKYRFNSEFRYSFDNDDEFLKQTLEDILEERHELLEGAPYIETDEEYKHRVAKYKTLNRSVD